MSTLTPITIGDQIVSLPADLASEIAATRQRFDAMKDDVDEDSEDESESEDDEDDSKSAWLEKMKAAKAKKAKKDSDDLEGHFDAIEREKDALQAENEILSSLIADQYRGDADDEEDSDRSPQELALELAIGFDTARPYLEPGSSIVDFADIYDIYQAAIEGQYPDADIDYGDEAEIMGAFKMMIAIKNPRQVQPTVMSLDSDDYSNADRVFAESMGARMDSAIALPEQPQLKPLY